MKNIIDNCEFEVLEKKYGDISIKVAIVKDFDDLLNHYVEHAPDDTDMIPYYADLWPSAEALAKILVKNRELIKNKDVLELGAGLSLPSLICGKLGANRVVASDYHPDNSFQVFRNAELNSLDIGYMQLDWSSLNEKNAEKFDIIIGSDLLYEKKSVKILVNCVKHMLKDNGMFILADPGRDHIQDAVDQFGAAGIHLELLIKDEILILSNRKIKDS
jgi:predicted nicotinamide N-methyase